VRPRRWPTPGKARIACWWHARWRPGALDDKIKAIGGSATLVPLDVTDGPGIDRLGAALYERFKKLDILLGNAGILGTLSRSAYRAGVFERVMAVNVTANWRLIRSLDPCCASPMPAGRSSSRRARHARSFLLGCLRRKQGRARHAGRRLPPPECAHTIVRVNLYNPGPTRTGMRKEAFPGEDPQSLPSPRGA